MKKLIKQWLRKFIQEEVELAYTEVIEKRVDTITNRVAYRAISDLAKDDNSELGWSRLRGIIHRVIDSSVTSQVDVIVGSEKFIHDVVARINSSQVK